MVSHRIKDLSHACDIQKGGLSVKGVIALLLSFVASGQVRLRRIDDRRRKAAKTLRVTILLALLFRADQIIEHREEDSHSHLLTIGEGV
jgi:heme/copper-type cytochrome/quinol oxidase subunit 3